MIRKFPAFSKLGIEHKAEIRRLTAAFEPYSDFNFTSLFCWDTDGSTEVALLNGNLVIKLPDYINGKTIYSMLGTTQVDKSIERLLTVCDRLQLVPATTVQNIVNQDRFVIREDRDNFDYVYALDDLVDLPGKKYKVKRNKTNKFMRQYEDRLHLKNIRFTKRADHDLIKTVFENWVAERDQGGDDNNNERAATNRLLEYAQELNLTGVFAYVDGDCVGFSINEIVSDDYAICHFQKAILAYEHLDVFISNLVAKELRHFGCTYVNWEQDLGIRGMRDLKTSYQQFSFLKKYQLSSSSGTS